MLALNPGEWVRVVSQKPITPLPDDVMGYISKGDTVKHANARASIYEAETLVSATSSATVSHGVCFNQAQGPDVAMKLDEPK
jgi:hypothetical protein